ncbi:MAG TPA: hypothetical protein VLA67_09820 [Nitrospiraceae bacterium]|nr:hypothetical protein [Nitrospiraceae bacterium]
MAKRASVDATSRNPLVTDFEKCARSLAQWLDGEPPLSTMEQLSLENHLHVIHLSYGAWKHKQSVNDQGEGESRSDT